MTNTLPWCRAVDGLITLALMLLLSAVPEGQSPAADAVAANPPTERHLIELGRGDSVSLDVYGQPDMTVTVPVAEDGSISVPLAGRVEVAGLSAVAAGQRVEEALRERKILVDPHVTLTIVQSHSLHASVLGEVRTPGRYPIDPETSVFDLLAQAGGVTEDGADVVFILRSDENGKEQRFPIDLKGYLQSGGSPTQTLRSGDSLYVPKAEQFYIYGQVTRPEKYRIEPGMTIIQAIVRAGGVTPRGSERRVEVKRVRQDGEYVTESAKPTDLVQPNDVIRVKESIF